MAQPPCAQLLAGPAEASPLLAGGRGRSSVHPCQDPFLGQPGLPLPNFPSPTQHLSRATDRLRPALYPVLARTCRGFLMAGALSLSPPPRALCCPPRLGPWQGALGPSATACWDKFLLTLLRGANQIQLE